MSAVSGDGDESERTKVKFITILECKWPAMADHRHQRVAAEADVTTEEAAEAIEGEEDGECHAECFC